jgi:DNA replication protein DnaC
MKKLETKQTVLLKHHLQQLKLPIFERECEEISFQCAAENIDHLGFLLRLSERELLDREARAAERRLKAARFPSLKTLETFDFPFQPSLNKMLVNQLMLGEYIDQRESIILIGQPGTGKTHLATAFGIKACQQGKKVRFFRVSDLITQLQEAREDRQLLRMKKSLSLLDVLVLDELGYIPASKAGSELFFDIISQAYERTSIIITTNLPFEKWPEVLGSARLTGAVLDRLTHRCHILEASGESYRLRAAKKRATSQKKS